jgi:hypothetical protein
MFEKSFGEKEERVRRVPRQRLMRIGLRPSPQPSFATARCPTSPLKFRISRFRAVQERLGERRLFLRSQEGDSTFIGRADGDGISNVRDIRVGDRERQKNQNDKNQAELRVRANLVSDFLS